MQNNANISSGPRRPRGADASALLDSHLSCCIRSLLRAACFHQPLLSHKQTSRAVSKHRKFVSLKQTPVYQTPVARNAPQRRGRQPQHGPGLPRQSPSRGRALRGDVPGAGHRPPARGTVPQPRWLGRRLARSSERRQTLGGTTANSERGLRR